MAVHEFTTPGGEKMVILPKAEYMDLAKSKPLIEEIREKVARGEEEFLPASMVNRVLDGENLVKVWREYRGLTLSALAEKADISQSYLSQIEGGARDGTVATYKKLAAALGVSLADLV